ncbi:MAG: hypothetical protein RBU37_06680 [Myxococcota bacterium]|jgi:hypothetical protein|nr:hypothetical protein [Myxococcota bacterium]
MAATIDVRAVSAVLYGVYKALYDVAGSSAGAIMRKASGDILLELEKLGVDFSSVNSIERLGMMIRETAVLSGMCEDISFTLEGERLRANISNCAFFPLTSHLREQGIPPFGCPFAALTVALAERNLGKRGRVVELQPTPGGNPGDTQLVVELHDRA